MKVLKSESFKPIVLEITLESMDDLYDLYHRVNLSSDTIENAYKHGSHSSVVPFPESKTCSPLWTVINDEMVKRRIK